MLLLTNKELISLIEKSADTKFQKEYNTLILENYEPSNAESVDTGIKLYFKNHEAIILQGISMKELFKPNYN